MRANLANMCLFSFIAALSFAGCDAKEASKNAVSAKAGEEIRDLAAPDHQSDPAKSVVGGFNASYLAGPWCLTAYELMSNKSAPNITYIFSEDGSFRFYTEGREDRTHAGSWEINNGRLALTPSHIIGAAPVTTIEPDKFVLEFSGYHTFRRGACGQENAGEQAAAITRLPVYVSEDGVGILRYSARDGGVHQYWLATGKFADNPDRPFETWSSDLGPYSGPDVAVLLHDLEYSPIPVNELAYELYERDPYRHVAYFSLVVDPTKAEPMSACGDVSRTDECSIKSP